MRARFDSAFWGLYMEKNDLEIYPKVLSADKSQKIYVRCNSGHIGEEEALYIKIQPMEVYAVKHTALYRVDEEERYSYVRLQALGNGLFMTEYTFSGEQRYDVKIKRNEEIVYRTHIYSVNSDLVGTEVFKGDTHLHTDRSDGEGTPFEVGCSYRAAGYDFIAITDHHLYKPSLEGKEIFEKLTDKFTVFRGEEIHNRGMGYIHIINFDGDFSVNEIIEKQDDYVQKEVKRILQTTDFDENVADRYDCAYRIFISEQIRKGNGVAIMAHPYWDCYGEYHMPTATVEYLLKRGHYDALEVLAGCDIKGQNGSNLQVALWGDLRAQGVKIPVLGASDSHSCVAKDSRFNKQYSLIFAKDVGHIKESIKAERSVAVLSDDLTNYFVFGQYRFVKYARFMMDEYFPRYVKLARKHALALSRQDKAKIKKAEKEIDAYKKEFFGW